MIKFDNAEVLGFEHAIRGCRNPMNSWEKSDSGYCFGPVCPDDATVNLCKDECRFYKTNDCENELVAPYIIGPNDHDLMMRLRNAGTDHRKFMRMIMVYVDITAPRYWWTEADTYKIGTVRNSCSTMHKIHEKEFTLEDFSCEHLDSNHKDAKNKAIYYWYPKDSKIEWNASPLDGLKIIIGLLNTNRMAYLETKEKKYWWQMIQLLPQSYNQKATLMLNYEVLANIYKSRKTHKLDEWRDFCVWIESLPYSELITGKAVENVLLDDCD